MSKQTAGIIVYRRGGAGLEVLLVHPGGPFWAKKDDGAWSIPKGELAKGEDPLAAARREFVEETGLELPRAEPLALDPVDTGSKRVHAWAVEGDLDVAAMRSNTFTIEWPPRSGTRQEFPEVDRAAWFGLEEARRRILKGQRPLIDALERLVAR
jgi:predicted NUDIX family NTP pyrophosphohydrolase